MPKKTRTNVACVPTISGDRSSSDEDAEVLAVSHNKKSNRGKKGKTFARNSNNL